MRSRIFDAMVYRFAATHAIFVTVAGPVAGLGLRKEEADL